MKILKFFDYLLIDRKDGTIPGCGKRIFDNLLNAVLQNKGMLP